MTGHTDNAATPYDGGRDEAVTPTERAPEVAAVVGQVAGADSHDGLAPHLAQSAATVGKLWTFRDLPDEELRAFATLACECVTAERAGTRHGFRCPAHRAQDELDRRAES